MIDLKQITVSTLEEREDYGKFSISPLERGYGQTIGNALRRVMLASLQGTAVTSVKIDGVTHEYTVLSGLTDDVIELILNVKNLRVVSTSDDPIILHLHVKGPRQVTAADFEKNAAIEIKNPELVISELTDKKATLDMEVTVEKGIGYVPANNAKRTEVGLIPLDVDFSPIERVNYEVKPTRVGQVTDYDELIVEVFTKQTIAPKDALEESANIIRQLFRVVAGLGVEESEEVVEEEVSEIVEEEKKPTKKRATTKKK